MAERGFGYNPLPARGVRTFGVVGDSIVAGPTDSPSYSALSRVPYTGYPGRCVVKRGYLWGSMVGDLDIAIDGAPAYGIPGMTPRPTVVVFAMGTNDLNTGANAVRLINGLRVIYEEGLDLGVTIRFATITPLSKAAADPTVNKQRIEVNAWIRSTPSYLDLDKALRNHDGYLRPVFDSGDGLHPNSAGHQEMSAHLNQWMAGYTK